MTERVKQYVSVNEGDFGKERTLSLTVDGSILPNALKSVVGKKVADLNAKIDAAYKVSGLNFDGGTHKISDQERTTLAKQLEAIVLGFNQEIARIDQEYIGRTADNEKQIQNEIGAYFSNKSIYVEKGAGLVSALKGYSAMDRDAAMPQRSKELPLN